MRVLPKPPTPSSCHPPSRSSFVPASLSLRAVLDPPFLGKAAPKFPNALERFSSPCLHIDFFFQFGAQGSFLARPKLWRLFFFYFHSVSTTCIRSLTLGQRSPSFPPRYEFGHFLFGRFAGAPFPGSRRVTPFSFLSRGDERPFPRPIPQPLSYAAPLPRLLKTVRELSSGFWITGPLVENPSAHSKFKPSFFLFSPRPFFSCGGRALCFFSLDRIRFPH